MAPNLLRRANKLGRHVNAQYIHPPAEPPLYYYAYINADAPSGAGSEQIRHPPGFGF